MAEENLIRVNKYLSEVGFCSRRKADELIEQGRVTINGKIPEMGTKVAPGDLIKVNGVEVKSTKKDNVYIAFNKPIGIVCTTNPVEKNNIIDFINFPTRIFPIGRLDKPSEGLILLTDDGDIVNKILRARNNHEKEYVVTVTRQISKDFIERMSNGVPILDTVTKKCEVEQLGKFAFRIILTQGLNRQIRRMCEYLGYEVESLKRIRIVNIPLDVPVGEYRSLTQEELDTLDRLLGESSKTEEETSEVRAEKLTKTPTPIKRNKPSKLKSPKEGPKGKHQSPKGRNRKS